MNIDKMNKIYSDPVKTNILFIVLHLIIVILIIFSFVLIKDYFTTKEQISLIDERLNSFISEQSEQNKIIVDMLVNTNYYLGRLVEKEANEEMPLGGIVTEGIKQIPEIEKPEQLQEEIIEQEAFISPEKEHELLSSAVSVYAGDNFGSGFVVSESGYILTNYHLVEDFTRIEVDFYDGAITFARLVKSDKDKDIALIRVIGRNLPYLDMGDSDKIESGQEIAALSHPSGFSIMLSKGKVEILDVREGFFEFSDPSINPGSSGGAVVDMDGNVIGMIVHTREGQNPFAIYSNELKQFLSDTI